MKLLLSRRAVRQAENGHALRKLMLRFKSKSQKIYVSSKDSKEAIQGIEKKRLMVSSR